MKFLFATILLFSINSFALTNAELERFRQVAVKVTNLEANHGGTGSIIRSDRKGSIILTNRHVCGVVEEGGLIIKDKKSYKVKAFKKSPDHDLCLIKISENLGVSLQVSLSKPVAPQKSFVTGHPLLMPNIITEGHFSDEITIQILVDVRECTEEEAKQDPMTCMFVGFPILESYNAQVTSNLIQPGNSGSAVLNEYGEIAGVVFAGQGQLGFAIIVPHAYVVYFLVSEDMLPYEKPTKKTQTTSAKEQRMKTIKERCITTTTYPNTKVSSICRSLNSFLQ